MKDRGSKLFGLIFFLFILGGIVYLLLSGSESHEENNYETIELNGNNLLSESEYLSFTELNDTNLYNEISLIDVKSKLEKHPYVVKAEVSFDGINKILAELDEKKLKAFIINNNKFNLITEDGELLPVLNKNLVTRLPIISNLKKQNKEPVSVEDLTSAFKIIDAVKLIDENMYESLAEINLRNGGDILLMFAGLKFPIVFGRKNETKKLLALQNIWNSLLKKQNSTFDIEYIDLRYKNKIFIGKENLLN